MTENKVSIVVPVYNAQKWLGYCLNSLLAQTWTEFEVILVNDGSTDDSLEICRNYAELDSRFRVLDVPNGGVSRARNLGVSQATGRYLVFVDSDDVVTPDMLEVMLDCARRTGVELVAGDAELVDFAAPEQDRPKLCAAWLGSGERLLDKQQFAEKRMQLIWYTSLLEVLGQAVFPGFVAETESAISAGAVSGRRLCHQYEVLRRLQRNRFFEQDGVLL